MVTPLLKVRLPNDTIETDARKSPDQLKTSYSIKYALDFALQLIGKSTI
jgi:hypothetical protein